MDKSDQRSSSAISRIGVSSSSFDFPCIYSCFCFCMCFIRLPSSSCCSPLICMLASIAFSFPSCSLDSTSLIFTKRS